MAAGEALPIPAALFVALFFLGFPLFWVAICGLIAVMGWRRIAAAFPATSDPPFSARQVRWGSMSIGGGIGGPNYGSCINAWLSDGGLWLRPSFLFRPFHPMIFIPWARAEPIAAERKLLFERVRVKLGGGVPDLLLTGRLGAAVREHGRSPRGRS